jgi:hypothetical protein
MRKSAIRIQMNLYLCTTFWRNTLKGSVVHAIKTNLSNNIIQQQINIVRSPAGAAAAITYCAKWEIIFAITRRGRAREPPRPPFGSTIKILHNILYFHRHKRSQSFPFWQLFGSVFIVSFPTQYCSARFLVFYIMVS